MKKDESVFLEEYKRLNKDQKEAVDTIDGPVMVVAGPGTGKTQILSLRIANILRETDTAPGNILALTFTESGVASMRK
ncbi:MAG: UvrD-helicase domain-containing protein, partial [Candidatus Pacebacteria bacterium]|nr:UvrD-helicase domain-containing protein [Candidatus Paceibacterota bacterium]